MLRSFACCGVAALLLLGPGAVRAEDTAKPKPADEPIAKQLSLDKAAAFLDDASLKWTTERKCGTCHTNYPYLMARPLLKDSPAHQQVRAFFEERVANWDRGEKGDTPRWDAEVVATAVALAFNDSHSTGKLHPLTRQALDRMWTLQKPNGGWEWLKCNWPPFEHDDYFGALYAAVGAGWAPDHYAESAKAQEGIKKLREYFKNNPPPNLHHRIWLLWASIKIDGLMSQQERDRTIQDVLGLQRSDGGWSLASFAQWKGQSGPVEGKDAPSDGYGTGLVVYVLRQTGMSTKEPAIQRGVAWLKSHQRESGKWFTRSLNKEHLLLISRAGTAYAVLALKVCE
jgi:squalene-hopene/tetraprenyl-beta-curcumene cyclase